jgi:AcrR family transcriptional regulator
MAKRSTTSAARVRPRAKGTAGGARVTTGRRRRPESRPAQIIEAALEVFGERGLANARLDDIARRAGLAKGTIYLYFPNKEELFRAVIRKTVVATIDRAEASVAEIAPEAQLDALMRTHWAFLRSATFERIYRLITGELHNFPELARFYADEVLVRGLRLMAGVIRRGIASGVFRRTEPEAAARMIFGSFVSHAIWRSRPTVFTHIAHLSDEKVYAQLSALILAALRPDDQGAHHHPASPAPRTRT